MLILQFSTNTLWNSGVKAPMKLFFLTSRTKILLWCCLSEFYWRIKHYNGLYEPKKFSFKTVPVDLENKKLAKIFFTYWHKKMKTYRYKIKIFYFQQVMGPLLFRSVKQKIFITEFNIDYCKIMPRKS